VQSGKKGDRKMLLSESGRIIHTDTSEIKKIDTQYISDESTVIAIEKIEACGKMDELAAVFEEEVNGGEIGYGCEAAVTHETMEDFADAAKNHWRECTTRNGEKVGAAVVYRDVQIAKGQRRTTVLVFDCGDFRAVLTY
jgi:hypothetical protein